MEVFVMTELLQKDWYILQNGQSGKLSYHFELGWDFTPNEYNGVICAKVYTTVWDSYKAVGIASFVDGDCVHYIRTLFKLVSDVKRPNKFKMIYSDQLTAPDDTKLYDYLDIVYTGYLFDIAERDKHE